jgi:acyl carrier protein
MDHDGTNVAGVRIVLQEILDATEFDSVDDHDSLFERVAIDSLHLLAIVSALEERYGIDVTAEDLVPDNFTSISTIAGFVTRKTGG